MKKCYIVMIFLLGLIVVLSVGRAVLHNTLSTSGIYVSKVEQEINSYKTQNAILSEELLIAGSLTNIAEKAKELGYRKMYLESMPELNQAVILYEKLGFEHQCNALGNSGHFGCNIWMVKVL